MQSVNPLMKSLDDAAKFITSRQSQNGLWSDFLTLAGESTFWVTGYVGYHLRQYPHTSPDTLRKVREAILANQTDEGGWGYGLGVPADADSTSWCLLLLSKLEAGNNEAKKRAVQFLLKHQNSVDGGFRTYLEPGEIAKFMGMNQAVSFEGWCSSQTCVTAVAAQALLENSYVQEADRAVDFLRRSQKKQGYWEAYWWNECLYSTYHCMRALNKKEGKFEDSIKKAQLWIGQSQRSDDSWSNTDSSEGRAFATALAIQGLLFGEHPEFAKEAEKGVEWLRKNQSPDGGWISNHKLRIPHPAVVDPNSQTYWKPDGKAIFALIKDQNRLFTTATVLAALVEYHNYAR